ncbi:MAG: GbsR/MarR family transcriptional regulator [Solirubrobacteraceae bacterium]
MTPRRGRDLAGVVRFVESFASALVDAGVPHMPALVFAALLSSEEGRLTADELASQLGVSRAAVSGAVRYLVQVGMIVRERRAGSRRYVYALLDPTWYEMVARREQILDRWITTMGQGLDAVGAATAAGGRLHESLAFFEFLRREMPALLERWREQQAGSG